VFQSSILGTIEEVDEVTEPQLKQEIEELTGTRCVLMSVVHVHPLPCE